MLYRLGILAVGIAVTAPIAAHRGVEAQRPVPPAPQNDTSAVRRQDRLAGPSLTDANILAMLDAGNAAEIESSKLAEKQGASKEVKSIATSLIRDHGTMQQEGRDLAKKLEISPSPPSPDPHAESHMSMMSVLEGKTGADFDLAFIEGQIEMHEQAIAEVREKFMPAAERAELRAHLEQSIPGLEAHLDMLKAARKQIADRSGGD